MRSSANKMKQLGRIEFGAQTQASVVAERNGQCGFTLVELITVMVIVGILAVAVLPRFFDANTFQSRGFNDQVISSLRYAQKMAIAQHRFVCVTIATNTILLSQGATNTCGAPLPKTFDGGDDCDALHNGEYCVAAPNGVNVGATDLNFDALGRPSSMSCITVSGNNTIKVEAETGYVHSVAVCP